MGTKACLRVGEQSPTVLCPDCQDVVAFWDGEFWARVTDWGTVTFSWSTQCPRGHNVDLPSPTEVSEFQDRVERFNWDVSDIQWTS